MADPAAALAPGPLALPNAPFGVATPQEQGETAPTGLDKLISDFIQGAAKLSMIPGQALQSHQPISTEEMIKPATDLAMMTTLGAGAVPAEVNALRSGLGSPIYHGSPRTDLSFIHPSERGPLGPGIYSTPTKELAEHYAGAEGRVYELPGHEDLDIFRGVGHRTDAEWFGFKDDMRRLIDASDPKMRSEVEKIASRMWSNDGYPFYQRLVHLYGSDEAAQALFKKAGFDGLSGLVDGHEVLLFGPQSKPSGR